ncbi:hypothetical protein GCM10027429_15450 [Marivirga atlantica]|jgi:hypothetical protein|uniref:Uncharacterized protein n=1 Tax=Marivirga atlantica TaxID=1548457 RepID=A0A937AKD3_9BACT|nr:hypothetical protein [Marivirga atlantica]MBL0765163.1 hypothetical protein [Marivirga atlantica]
MKSLLISILFIFTFSCQSNSQSLSKENVKDGWKYFFAEEFEKSKIHFEELHQLDSNNIEINEGLFYSTSLSENELKLDLLNKILGDSEENFYKYGMTATVLLKYYSTHKAERKEPFDFSIKEFEAYHTDGYLKAKHAEGQFKNQKKVGLWKYNNLGGALYKTIDYSDSSNIHFVTFYNQNRKIKEELTRIKEENGNTSYYVLKRVIYYQELPDKIGEYLFVSNDGFCVLDRDNPVNLDESTPDNIIEEEVSLDGIKYYIWKDGKRMLYLEKEY